MASQTPGGQSQSSSTRGGSRRDSDGESTDAPCYELSQLRYEVCEAHRPVQLDCPKIQESKAKEGRREGQLEELPFIYTLGRYGP